MSLRSWHSYRATQERGVSHLPNAVTRRKAREVSAAAPAISIIVTTTGQRASLAASLASARAQTAPDYEIVLVDDAPPGVTWRERPDLAPHLADPRLRVVRGAVVGSAPAARNAGLRAARGQWVGYLDDDNIYLPTKVARQHARAETSGAALVLCGLAIVASGRRRRRQCEAESWAADDLLLRAWADTNVIFHRRDGSTWWEEDLGTVDDACFFQAFIVRHRMTVVPNVPEALVEYHAHGGSRVNLRWLGFYRGQRRLLIRYAQRYSARARRIALLRALVAFTKFHPGQWDRWARRGAALVRCGGAREWRVVANAAGVKLPGVRRWMVR
jgi:hypothetical protein